MTPTGAAPAPEPERAGRGEREVRGEREGREARGEGGGPTARPSQPARFTRPERVPAARIEAEPEAVARPAEIEPMPAAHEEDENEEVGRPEGPRDERRMEPGAWAPRPAPAVTEPTPDVAIWSGRPPSPLEDEPEADLPGDVATDEPTAGAVEAGEDPWFPVESPVTTDEEDEEAGPRYPETGPPPTPPAAPPAPTWGRRGRRGR